MLISNLPVRCIFFAASALTSTALPNSLKATSNIRERAQHPPRKVDVHAHFYTPDYLQALKDANYTAIDLVPYVPDWNISAQFGYMDRNGINKTILSITSPGTFLKASNPKQAVSLSRSVNTYASNLKKKYPDRIGFFAAVPLPLVQESIAEIDYALDVLKADGIGMLSNHHGVYLGDPAIADVLAHLNKRNAVAFVHPTTPCEKQFLDTCPAGAHPDPLRDAPLQDSYITPMMEYFYDSTRSFIDLLLTGTATAQPNIQWIVTHAGIALPSLLDRASQFSAYGSFSTTPGRVIKDISTDQIRQLFTNAFWFDLAGMSVPNQIMDILRWVGTDKILYGSDAPFTDLDGTNELDQEAALRKLFPNGVVEGMIGGNAARLLKLK